ncbi:MAG: hypothetical protein ISS89_04835 [Candidatus Omnitrophica bacterium]|nr:hypothetical protein [Candidatus Omnitrophota bacterium]
MGQIMIVIGVIFFALSAWLIPHGYYVLQNERETVSEEEKLKLSPKISIPSSIRKCNV